MQYLLCNEHFVFPSGILLSPPPSLLSSFLQKLKWVLGFHNLLWGNGSVGLCLALLFLGILGYHD